MESELLKRNRIRKTRAYSVRNGVRGTATKPRLSYNKSNKYITVQLIDDVEGKTLAYVSSNSKKLRKNNASMKNCEMAKVIGTEMGKLAKDKGISTLVVDRGFRRYGGALKALAEELRASGLQF